jgi:rubrerythrin
MAQRTPQQDRRLFEVLDKWTERLDQSEKRIIALKSALEDTTKGSQLYANIQEKITREEKKRLTAHQQANAQQTRANKAYGENVDKVKQLNDVFKSASDSIGKNFGILGDKSKDTADVLDSMQADATERAAKGGDTSLTEMLGEKIKESLDNFDDLFGDEAGGGFMGIDYDELQKIREQVAASGTEFEKEGLQVYESNLKIAERSKANVDEATKKAMEFGETISGALGRIPLVGGRIKEAFDNSLKEVGAQLKSNLTKQLQEGNLSIKGMKTAFRATIPAIRAMGSAIMTATGGLTLFLGLLAATAVALVGLATKARDYAKDQGLAFKQSVALQGSIMKANLLLKGTGQDAGAIAGELIKTFGTLENVNANNIKQIGQLATRFGVATNDLISFQKGFMDLTGASRDAANDAVRAIGKLAQAEGVAAGQVISDIAGSMDKFAEFANAGADALARAAIEARKVGLNLSAVTGAAEKLLDFESSISAEFNAQVLTGKNLNLEEARRAALAGDFEKVTSELQKNVGALGDIQTLGPVEMKSISDALGLSAQEITALSRGEQIEQKKSTENLLGELIEVNKKGFAGNQEAFNAKDSSFGDFMNFGDV